MRWRSRAGDRVVQLERRLAEREHEYELLAAELRRKSFHDELTALPNRALLMDRIDHALARHRRHGGRGLAVLFVDLDGFKAVNDHLGHEAGNLLLVAFARRISGLLRDEDTFARIGGDEFALLLEDIDAAGAEAVASRITASLADPFTVNGICVHAPASIGLTHECGLASAEDLLRDADTAMYRAKAEGRNGVRRFEPAMRPSVVDNLALEDELRIAVFGDGSRPQTRLG